MVSAGLNRNSAISHRVYNALVKRKGSSGYRIESSVLDVLGLKSLKGMLVAISNGLSAIHQCPRFRFVHYCRLCSY